MPAHAVFSFEEQITVMMVMSRTYRRLIQAGIPKYWPTGNTCIGNSSAKLMHHNPQGLADWWWPEYQRANLWPGLLKTARIKTGLPDAFAVVYVPEGLTVQMVKRLLGSPISGLREGATTEAMWVQAECLDQPESFDGVHAPMYSSDLGPCNDPSSMLTMLAALGIQFDGQPRHMLGSAAKRHLTPGDTVNMPQFREHFACMKTDHHLHCHSLRAANTAS